MGWDTDDDDEFEIDLTADALDGLLPIRWVGPHGPNGAHPGDGSGHRNGNGNGHGNGTSVRARPLPVPRVVTLASFMGMPASTRDDTAREPAPVLDLREPDEWRDALQPISLRDVATSRGARFLTVVVVTVFLVLIAAVVLLWQRVETTPSIATTNAFEETVLTPAELRDLKTRMNSLETQLGAMLDPTKTVVTSAPPSVLEYKLDLMRQCLIQFQHAIDAGRIRGGQFKYC